MPEEKLLLLSCCAPCSCGVIAWLAQQKRNFTVLFYNPNIDTEQEHNKRLAENERVCRHYNVPFVTLPYEPHKWQEAVCGLENEPERGVRCSKCFELRLLRAAQYAKQNGFTAFSSVLGVSRHKDLDQVHAAAQKACAQTSLPYDATNWRKGGLEELRRTLIQDMHLYRQTYCGCRYSHRPEKQK